MVPAEPRDLALSARSTRASGWTPPPGSWASSGATRKSMVGNRRKDTVPELALRSAIHKMGLRFRVDARPLPELRRRADLVFRRARVAVFLDGCFWHACPEHGTWPKSNAEWWRAKIEGNSARDRETDRRLRAADWRSVRIWEHEDVDRAAIRVAKIVRSRLDGTARQGTALGKKPLTDGRSH